MIIPASGDLVNKVNKELGGAQNAVGSLKITWFSNSPAASWLRDMEIKLAYSPPKSNN